ATLGIVSGPFATAPRASQVPCQNNPESCHHVQPVSASGRIVVLGSLNADLVVAVPRLPRPAETVLGDRLRTFPGGKGANQAVAAARPGGSAAMVEIGRAHV